MELTCSILLLKMFIYSVYTFLIDEVWLRWACCSLSRSFDRWLILVKYEAMSRFSFES